MTGVFIDVNNQFYCINKKWEGRRLNYEKYMAEVKKYGDLFRAFAYGTQLKDSPNKFISLLFHLGFETRFKKVEKSTFLRREVEIAMDIVKLVNKLNTVIISSSNACIVPVIMYLKERGIRVIAIGCGISGEIKNTCDLWVEINEDWLE